MPYRRCVGAFLIGPGGGVFVGRRADRHPEHFTEEHAWQMPQGGIDEGEDPLAAARRELYEETNVRTATLVAEAPDWYAYDLPDELLGFALKGRYRGQTQKWFAFRLDGPESEIDVARPGGGHHTPEFDAWRWAPAESLPGLVVAWKRPVYTNVLAAFRHLVP